MDYLTLYLIIMWLIAANCSCVSKHMIFVRIVFRVFLIDY